MSASARLDIFKKKKKILKIIFSKNICRLPVRGPSFRSFEIIRFFFFVFTLCGS